MIIRCPQCEHTRTINESKIPPTAELVTCPKCKYRFRFRTLRHPSDAAPAPDNGRSAPAPRPPAQEVIRPQSAIRESAEQKDIWDAVDALHERWQAQLDQHVTEVEHPGILKKHGAPEPPPPVAADGAETGRQQNTTGPPQPPPLPQPPARSAVPPPSAPPDAAPEKNVPAEAGASGAPRIRVSAAGGQHSSACPPPGRPPAHEPPPATMAKSAGGGPLAPGQGAPVVFSYASDGAKPEERVEHSLRMLRQEQPARPLRDLGRLKEFPDSEPDAENEKGHGETAPQGILWENPARHGWAKSFMGTVRGVMFDAPGFFSGISSVGSLAPGYLFFLAMGYISIIATVAWGHAAALLLPGIIFPPGSPVALPVLLLLAPVALGLMLLFVTGLIRVVLSLLAPEKANFPVIYRIVSYSVAPFILSVVPFVGPGIGVFWFLAALILGCRHGLGLSWGLAVTAPLFPATALLGGLFWYFL